MTQNGPSMSTHCRKRMGNRTQERLDLEEIVAYLRGAGFEGARAIEWLEKHGKKVYPRNHVKRLLKILRAQAAT